MTKNDEYRQSRKSRDRKMVETIAVPILALMGIHYCITNHAKLHEKYGIFGDMVAALAYAALGTVMLVVAAMWTLIIVGSMYACIKGY